MTALFRSLGLALSLLALPAAADEVSLKLGATTLRAELTKAADWPAGPVVLLTHGTLAHNRMELIDALGAGFKERGVSSLAINLSLGVDIRASAMYDCPTPHRHRHEDAVQEMGAWLGWLKQQGVKKVALVGHSRGGAQTAWFATEHDDPAITSVVLIAPASGDNSPAEYEKRHGKLAPVLAEAKKQVAAGKGDALMDSGLLYCDKTKATAAALLSYYGPEPRRDSLNLVPKLKKPTLVVAASADEVLPNLVEQMKPLADGKRVTLQVVDGADHFFRDLYVDEVTDAAVKFIKSH